MPKPQSHFSNSSTFQRHDSLLLTPQQVANIYQVTSRTVLNWHYKGQLEAAFRQGRVIRFDRQSLAKMEARAAERISSTSEHSGIVPSDERSVISAS